MMDLKKAELRAQKMLAIGTQSGLFFSAFESACYIISITTYDRQLTMLGLLHVNLREIISKKM